MKEVIALDILLRIAPHFYLKKMVKLRYTSDLFFSMNVLVLFFDTAPWSTVKRLC